MTGWRAGTGARLERAAVPEGMRSSAAYLADLEGLRGVAIALVVVFHYGKWIIPVDSGAWGSPLYAFVGAGNSGVSLFFILSGFLLSRPFLREAAGGPQVSRRDYYARRALRILPLYYAAVLLASILCVRSLADLHSTVAALLFLNLFEVRHALMPYSAVWWSLATEVQFYLVLPLLPVLLRRGPGRVAGALLLAVAAAAYAALVSGHLHWPAGQYFLVYGILGRGPLFACGIGLAWLYDRRERQSRRGEPRVAARAAASVALFLVLATLGFVLRWVTYIGWSAAERDDLWWHIPEGALWSAVIWLVLTTRPYPRRLFANPVLCWLGVVSYSIYLVHYPLIDRSLQFLRGTETLAYLGWNRTTAVAGIVLAASCAGLSALTYRCIELPFLRRKARLDR